MRGRSVVNETSVTINLDNIARNARAITEKYKEYDYFFAVLKSSAYGHGEYIVNELVNNNINYIAVSYVDEALKIRKYNSDVPVLILEPISLSDIETAASRNFTVVVHDLDYLNELIATGVKSKLKIHIKIDSGMNRLGFKDKNEVKKAVEMIKQTENLYLEGIFTHFATIGMFDNHFDNQVESFKEITSLIDLKEIPIVHLGSSVILLSHPKFEFANGVRTGILSYGYNVAPNYCNSGLKDKLRNLRNSYCQKKYNLSKLIYDAEIDVKPAMSMTTSILQIKEVKKGECVGYGATYTAEEDIKIAVLPIGYNNGIGRRNAGRYVVINGKKYFAVGEIAMNMMVIRVDDDVKLSDTVYILGGGITLGELSRFEGNSISKTLLDVGKNNRRVYTKNNQTVFEEETR